MKNDTSSATKRASPRRSSPGLHAKSGDSGLKRIAPHVPFGDSSTLAARGPSSYGGAFFLSTALFWSGAIQSLLVLYGNGLRMRPPPASSQPDALFPQRKPSAPLPFRNGPSDGSGTSLPSLAAIAPAVKRYAELFFSRNPDAVLRYALELLGHAYASHYDLRNHIRNFEAKYQFVFADRKAPVCARFHAGRVRVRPGFVESPDVSLLFRSAGALRDLAVSPKPDILAAILKQDIIVKGNLTYLYKFAFLLRHLQRTLTGGE